MLSRNLDPPSLRNGTRILMNELLLNVIQVNVK